MKMNFREKMAKHGISIRFLGNLALLPLDLQKLMAEIQLYSKDYDKAILNVCISYTSQDEMTRGASALLSGVQEGLLQPEDISERLLDACLDTLGSGVDLLVRTSGEQRLSDFLLWQSAAAVLYFTPVLWPDFSFWDLARAVLHYQRHLPQLQKLRDRVERRGDAISPKEAVFLQTHQDRRIADLASLVAS